jgi:hypothetical protein
LKEKLDNKNPNALFEIKENDAAAFLNSVPTSTTKIAKRQRPSPSTTTTKRRRPVFYLNHDTPNNVSTAAVVPLAPQKKKQYPKK